MVTDDDLAGLAAVRPRLRQDAVFLRSDGGAYLRSSETAFFLRGQRAYRWLSTLGPYLNGEHSVSDLCEGLDAGHRDTVLGVVRALLERGFATDVPRAPAEQVDDHVRARFGRQLAYLEHTTGTAAGAAMAAIRAATVHVAGSGVLATTTAITLLRNGIGTVELLALDDPAGHGPELAAVVAELTAAGVPATATARAYPGTGTPDVLVHCAGPGELSTLPMGPTSVPTVPLVVSAGTAVLGPVTTPGAAPCWLCAQLRLAAAGDPAAAADLWRELALGAPAARPSGLSTLVAGMLGTTAAFEVFRLLAGLPSEVGSAALVQDIETLESDRARLFAHPACPRCRTMDVPEPPAMVEDDTDEERYEKLSVLVGGELGVFGRFTDDGINQAPLKVAGIGVHSPTAHHGGHRELTAFDDTSVLRARVAVIGAAVLDYVGRLPDRDDVVTGTADELAAAGHRVVRPGSLPTATGAAADGVRHWVPARSLVTGDTALVPLAAVYPMSTANADGVVEPAPVGAAAGSPREAATAGLTGALAHLAVREALRGRAAPLRLDTDAATASDEVLTLLKGLHHLGRQAAAYDLPGAAPAHAVLAVLGADADRLWAVGHGVDQQTALAAALRSLLGRLQVDTDGGSADLGDPLLPDLDPWTLLGPGLAAAPSEPRPATSPDGLPSALAADGRDALLVETTTRDVRAAGAVVAVVVLLAEDGDRAEGTRTEEGG
jgi:bacteriocin biosynthesis cyclodehydratase domain-containing protein